MTQKIYLIDERIRSDYHLHWLMLRIFRKSFRYYKNT